MGSLRYDFWVFRRFRHSLRASNASCRLPVCQQTLLFKYNCRGLAWGGMAFLWRLWEIDLALSSSPAATKCKASVMLESKRLLQAEEVRTIAPTNSPTKALPAISPAARPPAAANPPLLSIAIVLARVAPRLDNGSPCWLIVISCSNNPNMRQGHVYCNRYCFRCFFTRASIRCAVPLDENGPRTRTTRQGRWARVDLAPPGSSPLCCFTRFLTSRAMPT